jgi:hypothetical protein
MTQEEKELVIKDLSARLLYKVKFSFNLWDEEKQEEVNAVCTIYSVNTDSYCEALEVSGHIPLDFVKPYLRPLSSMTDEELEEYRKYVKEVNGFTYNINCSDLIDWFNRKMFDYRCLIPKGLALEAKEGMY